MKPKRDWLVVEGYETKEEKSIIAIPDAHVDFTETLAWVVKEAGPGAKAFDIAVGDIIIVEGKAAVAGFTYKGKQYFACQAQYVAFVADAIQEDTYGGNEESEVV